MMKKIVVTCIFFLYITSVQAQFFSVKKNTAFIKGGFSYVSAGGYFDNDGEIQELLDYRTAVLFINAEYGFSNRLNGLIKAPLFMSSSADFEFAGIGKQTQSASAMGDISIGLKYAVFKDKPWELHFTALATLPTGVDNNIYGLNTSYGIITESVEAKGRYNFSSAFYVNAYAGFTKRSGGFTDDIFSGGEAGYQFINRLWTILHLHGIDPLENGDDSFAGGLPGLNHNNSGYMKLGLEVDYMIRNGGIFLSAHYPLKGQFVHGAADFQAGIIYIIKPRSAE